MQFLEGVIHIVICSLVCYWQYWFEFCHFQPMFLRMKWIGSECCEETWFCTRTGPIIQTDWECSAVIALSSASQPFSGSLVSSPQGSATTHHQFAPVWPNKWKQCWSSHSYPSFTSDSINNRQPRLLCQSRLQSGSPVLLTSASAHTRHFGRQSFVCVCLSVVAHLSSSHLQRIFICTASCLQQRLFLSD